MIARSTLAYPKPLPDGRIIMTLRHRLDNLIFPRGQFV
jgi:hypothetical protein